jgi:general L-amino acid transport system permease protein
VPHSAAGKSRQNVHEKIPFWLDPKKRAIFYQIGVFCMVGLLAYYLVSNTLTNLERQNISSGFGFLQKESAFEIGESLIPYSAANSYGLALIVGALNTLKVAFIGIVATIILGTIVGVARLSTNWLVAKLAAIFIEVMQDIPILLQLFFWYTIFYETLPSPRQALNPVAGLFLCNRGVIFGVPESHSAHPYIFGALVIGCVLAFILRRWAKKRQARTGLALPVFRVSLGIIVGLPMIRRPADDYVAGFWGAHADGCPQALGL